jgi:nitroreductase
MEVYQAIYARHSVRDFSDRPIASGILERILDAGLRAPSNNHMHEWEFVIVQDREMRIRVIEKVQKHYTREGIGAWLDSWGARDPVQRQSYLKAVPKQYTMLLTAACLVLPFFRQSSPLLKPQNLSDLNAFASVWCCIENILVAAAAEGIFGVTRIPFEAEVPHIKEVVRSPADYELPCYLALGYPAPDAQPVEQIAVEVRSRMHADRW